MTVRTNADRMDPQTKIKILLGVESTGEIETIIKNYFFGEDTEDETTEPLDIDWDALAELAADRI